jgi:hypothetical protein
MYIHKKMGSIKPFDAYMDVLLKEFYVRHVNGSPMNTETERLRVIQCLQAAIDRRVSEVTVPCIYMKSDHHKCNTRIRYPCSLKIILFFIFGCPRVSNLSSAQMTKSAYYLRSPASSARTALPSQEQR